MTGLDYQKYCKFRDRKVKSIRKSDLQRVINSEFAHPRTCEQMLTTIRQILDFAVDDGIIPGNPCHGITMPRHIKQTKRALTDVEKQIIRSAKLPPMERAFMSVLYGTGMRPAEMFALTWEDVNFNSREVRVNKALQFTQSKTASVGLPKTDASVRVIPCPDFVLADLRAFYLTGDKSIGQTIFCDSAGNLRSRSGYRAIFDRAMKTCFGYKGLAKSNPNRIVPYMFRHNYCTECLRSGLDVTTVQHLLGEASPKMVLEVYGHFSTPTAETMAKIFG